MASPVKSAFLRSAVIKHDLGITAFTMPAGCYLALYTVDPTINDTGTEVTGGSYARQSLAGKWGTESGGAISSNASVTFTNLPACSIVAWGIRSALTGGNLLYTAPFDLTIVKNAGDSLVIASGDIRMLER